MCGVSVLARLQLACSEDAADRLKVIHNEYHLKALYLYQTSIG